MLPEAGKVRDVGLGGGSQLKVLGWKAIEALITVPAFTLSTGPAVAVPVKGSIVANRRRGAFPGPSTTQIPYSEVEVSMPR